MDHGKSLTKVYFVSCVCSRCIVRFSLSIRINTASKGPYVGELCHGRGMRAFDLLGWRRRIWNFAWCRSQKVWWNVRRSHEFWTNFHQCMVQWQVLQWYNHSIRHSKDWESYRCPGNEFGIPPAFALWQWTVLSCKYFLVVAGCDGGCMFDMIVSGEYKVISLSLIYSSTSFLPSHNATDAQWLHSSPTQPRMRGTHSDSLFIPIRCRRRGRNGLSKAWNYGATEKGQGTHLAFRLEWTVRVGEWTASCGTFCRSSLSWMLFLMDLLPFLALCRPDMKDRRTDHQALPVIKGLKFAANAWLHQRDFKGPFERGCN